MGCCILLDFLVQKKTKTKQPRTDVFLGRLPEKKSLTGIKISRWEKNCQVQILLQIRFEESFTLLTHWIAQTSNVVAIW